MSHKLESQRLYLRQICEFDRPNFDSLLQNTEVIELCFDPMTKSALKESFESRVRSWEVSSLHWLCLAVIEKKSGQFIGINGFRRSKEVDGGIEVGFLFLPKFQGLGYAAESLLSVLAYSKKLGFNSANANVTEGNYKSMKMLEKCSFNLARIEPRSVTLNGNTYANYVFSFEYG
ncbi:MAG: ribosomal-protein-alanine N-acetyltransferase [Flavobacteriales bacterium]|jgi:ribosomal-protein-alanine N-acetyltransferase